MSEGCIPLVEGDKTVGWVCRGSGTKYIARAKAHGERKYTILKRSRSFRAALRALADAFADNRAFPYKRGDVLFCQDYYDPMPIVEMRS
jgi:hypothetical protein